MALDRREKSSLAAADGSLLRATRCGGPPDREPKADGGEQMTKRLRGTIGGLLALTGCVQSFQPFYTEQAKSHVPVLVGEWDALKALDKVAAGEMKPWICREVTNATYEVTAYETNNVAASLILVTFTAAGQLFGDVAPGDPGEPANRFWNTSVTPVHTLWRLRMSNDVVSLSALSSDWLEKAITAKEVVLPYVEVSGENHRLYTATSVQWQAFLARHGTNEAAFNDDAAYVFRKHHAAARPAQEAKPAKPVP